MAGGSKRQRTLLSFIEGSGLRHNNRWNELESLLIYNNDVIIEGQLLRVAAFDLDETIITKASKRRFGRDENDWCFLLPEIPKILKTLAQEGFTILVFTNQLGIGLDNTGRKRAIFKNKVEKIFSILNIPVLLFVSTADDEYRKPCPGMWNHFIENHAYEKKILMETSFFVGDAAGRPGGWKPGKEADHASADRKFAYNINIPFMTPEQFFLGESKVDHVPDDFLPNDYLKIGNIKKTFELQPSKGLEVIIFVGSPASGKSTFYTKYLAHLEFGHVNQDELRTRKKCIERLETLLASGRSVVIDNTNPTIESRKVFIDMARKNCAMVKCFWFQSHPKLSRHLNAHRSITKKIPKLPEVAFVAFESRFESPSLGEGFDEIVEIPFRPHFDSKREEQIFGNFLI